MSEKENTNIILSPGIVDHNKQFLLDYYKLLEQLSTVLYKNDLQEASVYFKKIFGLLIFNCIKNFKLPIDDKEMAAQLEKYGKNFYISLGEIMIHSYGEEIFRDRRDKFLEWLEENSQ